MAQQLAIGNKVEPEFFECVSIFFPDIVGFTAISAQSNAMQIVVLLNSMYTMFDDVAHRCMRSGMHSGHFVGGITGSEDAKVFVV